MALHSYVCMYYVCMYYITMFFYNHFIYFCILKHKIGLIIHKKNAINFTFFINMYLFICLSNCYYALYFMYTKVFPILCEVNIAEQLQRTIFHVTSYRKFTIYFSYSLLLISIASCLYFYLKKTYMMLNIVLSSESRSYFR